MYFKAKNGYFCNRNVLDTFVLSNCSLKNLWDAVTEGLRGHAYFEFVNVEYPCKQEQFCETDLAAARMSKTIEVEYFVTLTL